jgi:uncharacterized protein (DUF1015 family)
VEKSIDLMAEILPLKAFRYHPSFNAQMEELISPLFDVVSTKQRKALYQKPFNSIHLSVPRGEHPTEEARLLLEEWKLTQIIRQDPIPGIYVYYQYFRLPGEEMESCRKGFIAQIKAYDWSEHVVLRHENTIASSVNDRIALLKATSFQPSPTHGLYEDPSHTLEQFMDKAIEDPIYDLEDYQGVREVLAVIHDVATIRKFVEVLKDKQVILADGHHRYEGAIAHRKDMETSNPQHQGNEGYNYHMMYFTNAHSKDLKILPTHRIFYNINLTEQELLDKASPFFTIRKLNDVDEIGELILQRKWAFGLVLKDQAYKIRLNPEVLVQYDSGVPEEVKQLDLMVLHFFFIEKVLGIPLAQQRFWDNLSYERNLRKCIAEAQEGKASFSIITKDVTMQQVLEVCKSGFTMPQKSTYFYPKTLSGLLFASIAPEDFQFPYEVFAI